MKLEQSISEWRKQMLAAGIQTPVPLEELEIHLREEIERQMLAGADAETAFQSAAEKIGRMETLKTEFTKVDAAKKSICWERWIVSLMSFGVVIPLGLYIVLKDEMSAGWRLAGFANFAAIALAILGWRQINKVFPVIPNQRTRLVIGLSLAALGMAGMIVFMNFVLPHFDFTEGQLGVVVLWGMTVMAAFGGVASGLEEAARKQNSTAD